MFVLCWFAADLCRKTGGVGLSVANFATSILKSQAPKLFQTDFGCRAEFFQIQQFGQSQSQKNGVCRRASVLTKYLKLEIF